MIIYAFVNNLTVFSSYFRAVVLQRGKLLVNTIHARAYQKSIIPTPKYNKKTTRKAENGTGPNFPIKAILLLSDQRH